MKITVNQIEEVLEKNYQEYINNKKTKNLMFVGLYSIGKDSAIKNWAAKHNDFTLYEYCYPSQMYKENESGILEKTSRYTYDDQTLKDISENKTVLYCRRINFGRNTSGDEELIKLIKDDIYKTIFGKEYNLASRMFTVATAYPNYQNNHNIDLSKELTSLFEIIEVEPN